MSKTDQELTTDSKELKRLVAIQRLQAKRIEQAIATGKRKNTDMRTYGFFETKIEEMQGLWKTFEENDEQLKEIALELDELEKCFYFVNDKFTESQEKYQLYMTDLVDGIKRTSGNIQNAPVELQAAQDLQDNVASNINVIQNTPLPRINLPSFNGDYNKWRSFHDLFISVVHNNTTLQPVQKLHYLKGCLIGEAERFLSHVPITNKDYQPAWEKLIARYDNKRLLINTQLKNLVNQPKINNEGPKGLRMLIDTTEECLQQLKSLQITVENWDTLLIHILVQRLPATTIKLWEEKLGDSQELPSLEQFLEFLQLRARIFESVSNTVNEKTVSQHTTKAYHVRSSSTCPACNEQHYVGNCKTFLNMDAIKRVDCILKAKRCFNCFSNGHTVKKCTNTNTCRKCSKRHHTLLHTFKNGRVIGDKSSVANNNSSMSVITSEANSENKLSSNEGTQDTIRSFFSEKETNAMLATLRVKTKDQFGKEIILRCLIDTGSQASFITHNAYKRLGCSEKPTTVEVSGLNQQTTAFSNCQVSVTLTSEQHKGESIKVDLLVIDKVTDKLPSKTFRPSSQWTHLKGLKLADPTYWKSGPVDILLGVNVFAQIVQGKVVKGPKDAPIAIKTSFGWILLGTGPKEQKMENFFTTAITMEQLNQNLMKFWESEEVIRPNLQKPEDLQCEKYFEDTHTRLKNGQYQVRLPFIEEPILGTTRELATKRFHHLQRKFLQNVQLEAEYSKCLNEYITLGHMEPIKNKGLNDTKNYYIPHHAVFKESSTTKLRVVFDASAKSSNGKSLNEQLLIGPPLQPKLFATLLKWRKYKISITADIEKMYRMIRIHPNDQRYQRIFWLNPDNKMLTEYELKTVTFGTASAPYLAIKTLLQLAQDEKDNWPLAAAAAKTDFYVDDLLTGADTLHEAKELQQQCIRMLKAGNFNLRKWSSNCKEILSHLPLEHVETQKFLQFDEKESVKTLGIQWIPQGDYFAFKIKEHSNTRLFTKRNILSEIASLFDPLGWIAPVIIIAKIIMQNIWISGCSWDSIVNDEIRLKWDQFKNNIIWLETLKIPRWIGFQTKAKNVQLHGFCDASMTAYAAVIYLRVQSNTEKPSVYMVTAKTRVAPIKPITLPRLELSGATLLANLLQTTLHDMQLEGVPITAWTDSMITLQWIKSNPTRWKTYVANRIAEIHENVNPDCWRHVPTKSNPADIASRGLPANELRQNKMWWHGPDWLSKPEEEWPEIPLQKNYTNLEAKNKVISMLSRKMDEQLLNRYSSFKKLYRVIARLKRFTYNAAKNHTNKLSGSLTIKEMEEAKNIIFKSIQETSFTDEYTKLRNGKQISNSSKILTLTPFIDKYGVMRVGGRLENADLSYDQKYPIILPPKHTITQLIIDEIHKYTLHGGRNLVVNTSRQFYWILNAKQTIANRINNCNTCIRHRQKLMSQLMGNLPAPRVTICKAFTNTGIDYAGPVMLKTSPHRSNKQYKGYFCVFVCMATKAIHLELVSDLTSTAFLAALKRFIARRGLCKNIYSDCGSNFKGAVAILDKETKDAIKSATNEAAKQVIIDYTIKWHFNPPAAPHFGGIWEAGVKAAKYHLKRVIGKTVLTYEEYATLLAQVEACLNSRPLCSTSNSLEDQEILTPGHFLIGQALNALPEPNVLEENIAPTKRWKHIQYMTRQFWKNWSKDYLNQLQQRKKWQQVGPNIRIGDIVLLKDETTSPTGWPLARVKNIFPGKDNLTRVVELKTSTNIIKRPISKICLLPVNNCEVEDEDLQC